MSAGSVLEPDFIYFPRLVTTGCRFFQYHFICISRQLIDQSRRGARIRTLSGNVEGSCCPVQMTATVAAPTSRSILSALRPGGAPGLEVNTRALQMRVHVGRIAEWQRVLKK